jgi:hypothetical protein
MFHGNKERKAGTAMRRLPILEKAEDIDLIATVRDGEDAVRKAIKMK